MSANLKEVELRLAAAFGSPIGGVLYSLEEASSFWSRKVMWRSLVCTSVATMLLSWLHEKEFSFALPGSLAFQGLQPVFHVRDVPLFLLTSAAAGILGALVNTSHGWLARLRPPSAHAISRIVEACIVTFISVAVIFILPYYYGRCLPVPEMESDEDFWFAYTCPKHDPISGANQYNDLATLLFSVPHETIKHLLQLGQDVNPYFTTRSLGIHTVSFLSVFILAYGIATPGGIFMPSMMVGASVGALLGCMFQSIFPGASIQPGLHALIGATALLGGVFRSSISVHAFVAVDLSSGKDSGNWSSPYFGHITTKQLQFLEHAMRVYHFCHHSHRRDLTSRPEALDELDLDTVLESHASIECKEEDGLQSHTTEIPRKKLVLDLRPFMNRAPLTVRGECSAQRVYVIFRTLGLRHLCVTDSNNRVVGMITRKDVASASKKSKVHDSRGSTSLLRWDSDSPTLDERTARDILYSLP